MSRWDPDPDEIRDVRPYDYATAKRAIAHQSREQTAGEQTMREAAADHARKEEAYRLALAQQITEVHANGAAWTVAQDLARGDRNVAGLRRERDIAEGVREAAQQAMWKHAANRRELEQLVDWSMRIDIGQAREQEPAEPEIVGGKRAA